LWGINTYLYLYEKKKMRKKERLSPQNRIRRSGETITAFNRWGRGIEHSYGEIEN